MGTALQQNRVPIPKWGPSASTSYGLAAVNSRCPDEISHLLSSHLVLCTFTRCAQRETRLAGSAIRTVTALPGTCEVVPAGADYWARWHHDKEVAVFSLESAWLRRLAEEDLGMPGVELEVDALPFASERIRQFATMLRAEFRRSAGVLPRIYTDSLLTLLGMELLTRHTRGRDLRERRRHRLAPAVLSRVLDLMRTQVSQALTLEDLAHTSGYSVNYFLRGFKEETGQTPHQFLINMRLDLAQKLLASTRLPIAEIALETGFSGQAHLTATMSRERQVTPAAYRRTHRSESYIGLTSSQVR